MSGGVTVGAANEGQVQRLRQPRLPERASSTTFSNLGIFSDDRDVIGINDRAALRRVSALLSVTEQDITRRQRLQGPELRHQRRLQAERARRPLERDLDQPSRRRRTTRVQRYSELDGSRTLLDRYTRPRDNESKGLNVDYTIAFKRTFEPRKHELSAEVRFNRVARRGRDVALARVARRASRRHADRGRERQHRRADEAAHRPAGLHAPLGATKLETGLKCNARWLDRDLRRREGLARRRELGAQRPEQRVQLRRAGPRGVRGVEPGRRQGRAAGRPARRVREPRLHARRDKSYPYHYTSFFPSGVLSYNLTPSSQAKISYSRRIRRPGTQELNPFPSFFDVQNVFIGNPALNPEYTDAYRARTTTRAASSARSSCRRSIGTPPTSSAFIINTDDMVDGRDVTTISFKNLATSNSWGTDLNGSLRLGKRFNGFAGGNVFKLVTEGGSTTSVAGTDAVTWSARVNVTAESRRPSRCRRSTLPRADEGRGRQVLEDAVHQHHLRRRRWMAIRPR